jgi:hypothetical protein
MFLYSHGSIVSRGIVGWRRVFEFVRLGSMIFKKNILHLRHEAEQNRTNSNAPPIRQTGPHPKPKA